jgi:hypothetical protein
MKFWQKLEQRMLNRLINWKLAHHEETASSDDILRNLAQVQNVLLILPTDTNHRTVATQTVRDLQTMFHKCRFTIVDLNELPSEQFSWPGIPGSAFIQSLVNPQPDLLIDMNLVTDDRCSYIAAKSYAKLRIQICTGPFDSIYNLSFRTTDKISVDQKFHNLITQIKRLISFYPSQSTATS